MINKKQHYEITCSKDQFKSYEVDSYDKAIVALVDEITNMAPPYDLENPDQLDEWDDVVAEIMSGKLNRFPMAIILPNGHIIEVVYNGYLSFRI